LDPGHGIQLKQGPRVGRLIVSCTRNQTEPTYGFRSHVLYSDDHGKTWQQGGDVPVDTAAPRGPKNAVFADGDVVHSTADLYGGGSRGRVCL
jgi:hypothetical protein